MSSRSSINASRTTHVVARGPRVTDEQDRTDRELSDSTPQRSALQARSAGVVSTTLASYRRRRGGGRSGGDASGGSLDESGLFSDAEIESLEASYAEGITAVQVVELFTSREIRFSEASFRKYVQLGLLPRSRRVGRKGKHRGSMGVYPAKTVRRVNEIKRLMADGYTIEEIQSQFLRFTDTLENLDEGFNELFEGFRDELAQPRFDKQARRDIARELEETRNAADDLLARLDGLSQRVTATQNDQYRNTGAAGSAEDLL